jgi:hypothetical protein
MYEHLETYFISHAMCPTFYGAKRFITMYTKPTGPVVSHGAPLHTLKTCSLNIQIPSSLDVFLLKHFIHLSSSPTQGLQL